jgi:ketosteroid isomerase-like protein
MSRYGIRAAAFGIILAFAPPLAAHEPVANESAVSALSPETQGAAKVVDAFHAALRRGDARGAADLLADDVLILEGGGAERSKAEYQAHHLGADMAFSRAVSSSLTRRTGRACGDTAWIASEGRVTGSYKGKALDVATAETMVLRRIGGQWKIAHIHWSTAR